MLSYLIISIVAIFIAFLLRKVDVKLENPFVDRLRKETNSAKRVMLRRKILFVRYTFYAVSLVVLSVLVFGAFKTVAVIEYLPDAWTYISFTATTAILYSVLLRNLRQRSKNTPFANFSLLTKDDVLCNKEPYVLYLRGFSSDVYLSNKELGGVETCFSEPRFAESLRKYCRLFAVGMTKEVEAANGAERVYLEDETWQEDVRALMEQAHRIVVLVNDRQSCIWEIVQCRDMLKKTLFIVDDIEKYEAARNKVQSSGLTLPPLGIADDKRTSIFAVYVDSVGRARAIEYPLKKRRSKDIGLDIASWALAEEKDDLAGETAFFDRNIISKAKHWKLFRFLLGVIYLVILCLSWYAYGDPGSWMFVGILMGVSTIEFYYLLQNKMTGWIGYCIVYLLNNSLTLLSRYNLSLKYNYTVLLCEYAIPILTFGILLLIILRRSINNRLVYLPVSTMTKWNMVRSLPFILLSVCALYIIYSIGRDAPFFIVMANSISTWTFLYGLWLVSNHKIEGLLILLIGRVWGCYGIISSYLECNALALIPSFLNSVVNVSIIIISIISWRKKMLLSNSK